MYIVVTNLIRNAFHVTSKGLVTITLDDRDKACLASTPFPPLPLFSQISHLFHILFTACSRIQRYASLLNTHEGNEDAHANLLTEEAKWQFDVHMYSKVPNRPLDG
ncbi:MAG: hypothetical protein WC124_05025 [Desulfoplanes sp.]